MSEKYKLKEVHIALQDGIILQAKIDTIEGLKSLLSDLSSAKLQIKKIEMPPAPPPGTGITSKDQLSDDPISRLETKAALPSGSLEKAKVIAFKDNVPQLLKPNIFGKVTDALLVLLLSVESGLARSKIDYESFKGLYEAQNIKSGSPMGMLLTNIRNSGYLDKRIYSKDRGLCLTAKGETKAIEVLKALSQ